MATPAAQPYTVLVVDDSAAVRGMITQALEEDADIKIIGSAANGKTAITAARNYKPEVIILDIEMPEMDGLTAMPHLLEASPHARIVIASTLSQRNAEISLRALELGASDYLPKPSSRGTSSEGAREFHRELLEKVKALGNAVRRSKGLPSPASAGVGAPRTAKEPTPPTSSRDTSPLPAASLAAQSKSLFVPPVTRYPKERPQAVAIGSSTGGPQALLKIVGDLKGKLASIPIFLTQHMPPTFTTLLAEHLARAGERVCVECKEGEIVKPGCLYVAPGDYHMVARGTPGAVTLHITKDKQENYCRPAVDPMLRSLAAIYGKYLLVVILTGMGQDGLLGAQAALERGGSVIAQDEATSVVWGMPRAVAVNNLCSAVLPIGEIGSYILTACEGGAA